jgi:hypothetical protein
MAHIVQGEFREINSSYGHDGFLKEVDQITDVVRDFWSRNRSTTEEPSAEENPLTLEWSRSA